eukprot:Sspe_Gene.20412::Locus_7484_Transcript_1_1_Confidence_1.000_Length_3906::g.20412::m.20412
MLSKAHLAKAPTPQRFTYPPFPDLLPHTPSPSPRLTRGAVQQKPWEEAMHFEWASRGNGVLPRQHLHISTTCQCASPKVTGHSALPLDFPSLGSTTMTQTVGPRRCTAFVSSLRCLPWSRQVPRSPTPTQWGAWSRTEFLPQVVDPVVHVCFQKLGASGLLTGHLIDALLETPHGVFKGLNPFGMLTLEQLLSCKATVQPFLRRKRRVIGEGIGGTEKAQCSIDLGMELVGQGAARRARRGRSLATREEAKILQGETRLRHLPFVIVRFQSAEGEGGHLGPTQHIPLLLVRLHCGAHTHTQSGPARGAPFARITFRGLAPHPARCTLRPPPHRLVSPPPA